MDTSCTSPATATEMAHLAVRVGSDAAPSASAARTFAGSANGRYLPRRRMEEKATKNGTSIAASALVMGRRCQVCTGGWLVKELQTSTHIYKYI